MTQNVIALHENAFENIVCKMAAILSISSMYSPGQYHINSLWYVVHWPQDKIYLSGRRDFIDGLMQERRNSSALAMKLPLSCINPSIYTGIHIQVFLLISRVKCRFSVGFSIKTFQIGILFS